jgi:hypothetical protein
LSFVNLASGDSDEGVLASSDEPAGEPDYINELEQLARLRDEGVMAKRTMTPTKSSCWGFEHP